MAAESNVVIIGGGVTGAGILWDLILRGIQCTLIEKDDLCNGASGRNHGLLHSGGRYAVEDPEAARECAAENLILKRIAPWAVEPCGGLFVRLADDDPEYTGRWLEGCREAGIKTERQSPAGIYKDCPYLNKDVAEAFRVEDASIDVHRLVQGLVLAAQSLGAAIKTKTYVTGFVLKDDAIVAVKIRDIISGEEELIYTSLVINAGGAWAGTIARLANCQVDVLPDRGVLLVFNSRLSSCVINRLRVPGDGDILVPSHNVSIFGTTSSQTHDPDQKRVERHEVEHLLLVGGEMFPGFKDFRLLRAFAGARPLLGGNGKAAKADGRLLSRSFQVINHGVSDGVGGLISSVGGKFTTFRLMAAQTASMVANILAVSKPSVTSNTAIPRPEKHQPNWGVNLKLPKGGQRTAGGSCIICECEQVTAGAVLQAARELSFFTLNDLRNRSRFGMGTCQGTFCTYRVLELLSTKGLVHRDQVEELLCEFLRERWQGILPVLGGDQLKEVEFACALYVYTMGLDLVSCPEDGKGSAYVQGASIRALL